MHSTGVIAAASALLAMAAAVPMHGHMHQHHERDLLWVTKVEEEVVTVAVTETVWVNPGQAAPTNVNSPAGHGVGAPAFPSAHPTDAPVAPVASKHDAPPAAAAPSSTSTYVPPPPPAPTTTSTYVPVAAPPAPAPTTSTSTYVAPAAAPTTQAPAAPAAPSSTWSPPAAAPSPAAGGHSAGGLSSGLAAAGTKYTGDLTYYSVGLGSCGITNTDSQHVVAISHVIFDSYGTANPNNNPVCGKTLTITGFNGQSFQATVVDRCVGCAEADLDMGEPFFNEVTMGDGGAGKPADGRAHGFTWEWN